jgi:hypothetical protein
MLNGSQAKLLDLSPAANHRKIVGVEYATGGGSSAGKAQQIIAPGRDNPLAARHECTFSKSLLYEK